MFRRQNPIIIIYSYIYFTNRRRRRRRRSNTKKNRNKTFFFSIFSMLSSYSTFIDDDVFFLFFFVVLSLLFLRYLAVSWRAAGTRSTTWIFFLALIIINEFYPLSLIIVRSTYIHLNFSHIYRQHYIACIIHMIMISFDFWRYSNAWTKPAAAARFRARNYIYIYIRIIMNQQQHSFEETKKRAQYTQYSI